MSNGFVNDIKCDAKNIKYAHYIDTLLEKRKAEILDFFNASKDIKFNIYLYDTINDLVKGLKDRGFDNMPDYMCACHKDEDNSLNYFEPLDEYRENTWCKSEYDVVIFHEAVHAVQYTLYGSQPEWLTEGIAKILDGQYKNGKKYLIENYINNYEIPDIEKLKDDTFCTDKYDGYDLSYLMVSYLIDYYGKEEFLNIIKDNNRIKNISDNLITKATSYYKKIYNC